MLVLNRSKHDRIIVRHSSGDVVTIEVADIRGNTVKIGVDGPMSFKVYREEIMPEPQEPVA